MYNSTESIYLHCIHYLILSRNLFSHYVNRSRYLFPSSDNSDNTNNRSPNRSIRYQIIFAMHSSMKSRVKHIYQQLVHARVPFFQVYSFDRAFLLPRNAKCCVHYGGCSYPWSNEIKRLLDCYITEEKNTFYTNFLRDSNFIFEWSSSSDIINLRYDRYDVTWCIYLYQTCNFRLHIWFLSLIRQLL